MILNEAVERRCYTSTKEKTTYYSDIPLGVYVIRGDSMVLLGNIADDTGTNNNNNSSMMYPMKELSLDELDEKMAQKQREGEEPPLTWDFDTDLIA